MYVPEKLLIKSSIILCENFSYKCSERRRKMKTLKGNILTQILIAFIVAIILGLIFGSKMDVVKPLGDLFLRLIKFIIVPLVLSTLVIGVASIGDPKSLGRVGSKTIVYYLVTTAIAIVIGLAFAFLISPGKGLSIDLPSSEVEVNESEGVIQTFLNIV